MNNNIRKPIRVVILLLLSFILGFMIGAALSGIYEGIFPRANVSNYIRSGFGPKSVKFVLTYVSSNDLEICHYILFYNTDRNVIRTHENAMLIARARAMRGDPLLIPFIYEYARDNSWDKGIRSIAINDLIFIGGTQDVAVVREIASRTNDPMAAEAIELLKKYPYGYRNSEVAQPAP